MTAVSDLSFRSYMPKYHELIKQMDRSGAYMTNAIGMCQREIRAVRNGEKSRIDSFLMDSDTYAASLRRVELGLSFNERRAKEGFLIWTHDLKTGEKYPPFPVSVDDNAGIVRQKDNEVYGLLSDVRDCLYFRDQERHFAAWGRSGPPVIGTWSKPSAEEIRDSSALTSPSGSMASGRRRVGQATFRQELEVIWKGRCAVTGCANRHLLRASHIVRWRDGTTIERLDQFNGLLLAAHIDAAFEVGLISFSDDGSILVSSRFTEADRSAVGITGKEKLQSLPKKCKPYLARHRTRHGFNV